MRCARIVQFAQYIFLGLLSEGRQRFINPDKNKGGRGGRWLSGRTLFQRKQFVHEHAAYGVKRLGCQENANTHPSDEVVASCLCMLMTAAAMGAAGSKPPQSGFSKPDSASSMPSRPSRPAGSESETTRACLSLPLRRRKYTIKPTLATKTMQRATMPTPTAVAASFDRIAGSPEPLGADVITVAVVVCWVAELDWTDVNTADERACVNVSGVVHAGSVQSL